jgi:hypothetical protein
MTPQDWTGAHFVEAGTSSTKRGFIFLMVYSEPMNMLVLSVEIRRAAMLKPNEAIVFSQGATGDMSPCRRIKWGLAEVIDYEIDLGDFPSFSESTVDSDLGL